MTVPKQPTNAHGQQVTATGHVLKTSEIIKQELILLDRAMVSTDDNYPTQYHLPLEDLVPYILGKLNDEYYRGVKVGIDIGRREARAIIDSAKEGKSTYQVVNI